MKLLSEMADALNQIGYCVSQSLSLIVGYIAASVVLAFYYTERSLRALPSDLRTFMCKLAFTK